MVSREFLTQWGIITVSALAGYLVLPASVKYAFGALTAMYCLTIFLHGLYRSAGKSAGTPGGDDEIVIREILHRLIDAEQAVLRVLLTKSAVMDVAVIDAPNAPILVVSTAMLHGGISDDELEGVLAHEISHVRNRDVLRFRLMFIFLTWLAAASLGAIGLSPAIQGWAYIAPVAMIVYALGRIPLYALVRSREYAADKTTTELTRNPVALVSALQKMDALNTKSKHEASPRKMIVPEPIRELFRPHPTIEKRIARLEMLAA